MKAVVLFWLLGFIWGSNFIYMKLASELIAPMQIVFLRVLFGFIPVIIYAVYAKALKVEHVKHVGHFLVMSLIATSIYYFGFVKGASLLLSGVAGALSASIPLFSFVLALFFIAEEKVTTNKVSGILIGFIGVILIARPFSDMNATNVEGVLYMLMGSLSVGASFIYAKKYILSLNIPAAALTTYQLGLSLLTLFVFTDFSGVENITSDVHIALGLVVGLGLLGTGLAYIIYYYIIEKLGAVSASSVTYIPPIVALAIGAILVGENIEMTDYIATVLIIIGVVLINKGNFFKAKS